MEKSRKCTYLRSQIDHPPYPLVTRTIDILEKIGIIRQIILGADRIARDYLLRSTWLQFIRLGFFELIVGSVCIDKLDGMPVDVYFPLFDCRRTERRQFEIFIIENMFFDYSPRTRIKVFRPLCLCIRSSATQIRSLQLGTFQIRPTQIGPYQSGILQISPTQIRPTQIRPLKICPPQISLNQKHLSQICFSQISISPPHRPSRRYRSIPSQFLQPITGREKSILDNRQFYSFVIENLFLYRDINRNELILPQILDTDKSRFSRHIIIYTDNPPFTLFLFHPPRVLRRIICSRIPQIHFRRYNSLSIYP